MFVIPRDRLPPGFADRIGARPADPAEPRPAATAVLARDSAAGPEVLLLRRLRSAGFVPGAYVFPGGRVDAADSDPRLLDRAVGAPEPEPPPPFWMAAVREIFEETGVLLAAEPAEPETGTADQAGESPPSLSTSGSGAAGARLRSADSSKAGESLPSLSSSGSDATDLDQCRNSLLDDRATLLDVLMTLDLDVDLRGVVHIAHWITPVAEPRRYDTHFFLARLPAGATACPDPREMSDAVWLRPHEALARFHAGSLPMVFPTVHTLEELTGYDCVEAIMAEWRSRPVPTILPRLVRTDDGVAIVIDDGGEVP